MIFTELPLSGAYIIDLEPFRDDRGLFARTFCAREFSRIGFSGQIVQINHSVTTQTGTVRGMHYQVPPACEVKIIRCVHGKVFDVIIDLRSGSSTFLKWHGVELSRENMRMIYIPKGFAHGFQAVSEGSELIYHHSEYYTQEHERGLRFDDPALGIKWPLPVSVVSEKDGSYQLINSDFKGVSI